MSSISHRFALPSEIDHRCTPLHPTTTTQPPPPNHHISYKLCKKNTAVLLLPFFILTTLHCNSHYHVHPNRPYFQVEVKILDCVILKSYATIARNIPSDKIKRVYDECLLKRKLLIIDYR